MKLVSTSASLAVAVLILTPSLALAQQPPVRAAHAVRSYNAAWLHEAQTRPALESGAPVQEQEKQDDQPSLSDRIIQEPNKIVWPSKAINETVIDIRLGGDERVPADRSGELAGQWEEESRVVSDKLFAWAAPDIRYQPLYFEDVALERYGQTFPPARQSIASGVHFFKSAALRPLQMWHDHPYDCDHPLGFCRPGNRTPCVYQRQYFGLFRD